MSAFRKQQSQTPTRYEVCPKCGSGWDEDEQANQACDACGYEERKE